MSKGDLAHIGLKPEVQGKETLQDIRTPFQLLAAIEKLREQRMEYVDIPVESNPVIQILAGYQDGKVDSWDIMVKKSASSVRRQGQKGTLYAVQGNAKKFLDAEAVKKMAKVSDGAKAKSVYDRVAVDRVYGSLERRALEMLKKHELHYALYNKCMVQYVREGTAAVGWLPNLGRFVLRINKAFVVYMTTMNLMNGYPQSTIPALKRLSKSRDPGKQGMEVLATTLLYVLMHEMGHILFQHVGKKQGLYSSFNWNDVNIYGDVLINLDLTKQLSGKVNKHLIPNVGLGKDRVMKGFTENAQKAVQKFVELTREVVPYEIEALSLSERYRTEPASLLLVFSPGDFVNIKLATSNLLKFYKAASVAFDLDRPKNVTKAEEPYKPPTKVTKPVEVGQVVMIEATGEMAVVVGVGQPEVGAVEGDFQQEVQIVRKSELSEEDRQALEDAIAEAGMPVPSLPAGAIA